MKTDDLRESYLEFFEKKGHKRIASDSLVPANDPTLLFTGAGMNQFKEYFLGIKKDFKRATSSQKCLRTGDLDEVGKTAYHHSFFEMLGNFSFGDYFKEEAIAWAWEYLTQVLKLAPERLRISVHKTDDEAFKIWRDKIKVREAWIYKLGDKSNFWPANAPKDGPNGPCGPCSEIYYDQNPGQKTEDIESSRFAEIWNLVFTQFDRQDGGKLAPLKNKNIDTGMGLERLACVLQGKKTNYEIDIFQPLNKKIANILLTKSGAEPSVIGHQYAIADHSRAIVFCLSDGIIPSNEGRGYVVRKLIRRALWRAHEVKPEFEVAAFLHKLVPVISEQMGGAYPELLEHQESIAATVKGEEERFLDTLGSGLRRLENHLKNLKSNKSKIVPGEIVFELYDTYGFPDELTRNIASEHGFSIDQKGFDELMEAQRKRAKDASQIHTSIFVSGELDETIAGLPETEFLGYEALESQARVLFENIQGKKGIVVLDKSPFYPEGGGQVGDRGTIKGKSFEGKIVDTQKKDGRILHAVEVAKGSLKAKDSVTVTVDRDRRERAMRNHTATHLLHAALRQYLGKQVRQLGSLVSPEKLRFDYSYSKPLTAEQIKDIEDLVNSEILKDQAIVKETKSMQQAKKDGAIAFFGEKYGDKVRIVTVPGFSKELCGGTHCAGTGQIGSFIITNDTSIASGTRRIEALTGEGALEHVRKMRSQLTDLAQALKTTPAELSTRVQKLQDSVKVLEKEKQQGVRSQVDPAQVLKQSREAGNCRYIQFFTKDAEMPQLRQISDRIRSSASKTAYLLASENGEKIQVLCGVSPDLEIDSRELFGSVKDLIQATGGGRKDLVQAGGRNQGQLKKVEKEVETKMITLLKGAK